MVDTSYVPDRGDIVWLNFSPQSGHEQAGHRPGLALFCPITSSVKGYPFEVALTTAGAVSGVVLSDQLKSLDWRARRVRFECRTTPQVMWEVTEKLRVLFGADLPDEEHR